MSRAPQWQNIHSSAAGLHSVFTIGAVDSGRFRGGLHESLDIGRFGGRSDAGLRHRRLPDRKAGRLPRAAASTPHRVHHACSDSPSCDPTVGSGRRANDRQPHGAGADRPASCRARRVLRLSPACHRQLARRRRGLSRLQQAPGHGRREIRRLCPYRARGEVRAARGRRSPVHRRAGLWPGLQGETSGGIPGTRWRETRCGACGRRGARRPAGGRHPARQGLHPAAWLRGRTADHHHQRLESRHCRLPRERARPRPLRQ